MCAPPTRGRRWQRPLPVEQFPHLESHLLTLPSAPALLSPCGHALVKALITSFSSLTLALHARVPASSPASVGRASKAASCQPGPVLPPPTQRLPAARPRVITDTDTMDWSRRRCKWMTPRNLSRLPVLRDFQMTFTWVKPISELGPAFTSHPHLVLRSFSVCQVGEGRFLSALFSTVSCAGFRNPHP